MATENVNTQFAKHSTTSVAECKSSYMHTHTYTGTNARTRARTHTHTHTHGHTHTHTLDLDTPVAELKLSFAGGSLYSSHRHSTFEFLEGMWGIGKMLYAGRPQVEGLHAHGGNVKQVLTSVTQVYSHDSQKKITFLCILNVSVSVAPEFFVLECRRGCRGKRNPSDRHCYLER